MEAIENLAQINYVLVILGFFAILFGAKEIIEIISYFKNRFRIKTGAEEDKETIDKRIAILEKHDNWQYKEITKMSKGDRKSTRQNSSHGVQSRMPSSA